MTEKPCTKCGKVKPLTAFYRCTRNKDGRRADCIRCFGARIKAREERNQARARWHWMGRYV